MYLYTVANVGDLKIKIMADKRILTVNAKCSDRCFTTLVEDGKTVRESDGYVPAFFPDGGGDYIYLEIDIETGQILNWQKPAEEDLEKLDLA